MRDTINLKFHIRTQCGKGVESAPYGKLPIYFFETFPKIVQNISGFEITNINFVLIKTKNCLFPSTVFGQKFDLPKNLTQYGFKIS